MRTFGIKEEFFIVEPLSGLPCAPPASARAELLALTAGGTGTRDEFLVCQLESNSPICTERVEALAAAQTYRHALARAAKDLGYQAVALGTPPRISDAPAVVSSGDRYRAISSLYGGLGSEHYISGLHVHVNVDDTEAGVIALNGLRRWLPALTACGSNSPYWRGTDSGFASWRNIHYRRWALHGIPPYFADMQDYEERMKLVLGADVVLDSGHVRWGARLSTMYPTLEVRVADAQLGASNSILLALVVRSLVDTSLNGAPPRFQPMPEALDLAQWQAAKFGLRGNNFDPFDGTKTSASRMLHSLMEHISDALERNGDYEYVAAGLARILERGTGAETQRRHFRKGGFSEVLENAAAAIAT
ncbi:carboxylate-amine ligase [Paeniglutamicibacter kerguelensis]|uniref:Putative glutamate--cysteine ligase 2 n=1 Tax=Paeniglutamicibacter kerguelensis TaxID=254788 RepID=A0ABS4XCV9_9MICC|nr:YbdK family carboxylate-amine ligase [Paeniglutamicibacter kerguelensis]MBP2386301.1 carboxylate-amine ligase [Paeniglutamicibacter kerguelensis]